MQVVKMPYNPDWVDYLLAGGEKLGKVIEERNKIIQQQYAQKAISDLLGKGYDWKEYYNPITGSLSYVITPPKQKTVSPSEQRKQLLGVMSGLINPKQALTKEQINQLPKRVAVTPSGGEVLAYPSQIEGEGNYPAATEIVPAYLRNQTGISKDEAVRAYLGLPVRKKKQGEEISQGEKIKQLLQEANAPAQGKKDPRWEKARDFLRSKGYTGTDAQIELFLKKNPNFR